MLFILNIVSSVPKNFHTMEQLDQKDISGESVSSQEEVVVASIRSALKELQESIQDVCKASLAKIVTICQYFSPLFFSPPLYSSLQTGQNCFFFVVNCDPIEARAPNGAAEASTTAADGSCQVNLQNTGTLTESIVVQR